MTMPMRAAFRYSCAVSQRPSTQSFAHDGLPAKAHRVMAYNDNVLQIANTRMDDMGYADMIRNDANPNDIREYLVSGEQTAITVRIPDTLRDAAKEAATLKGTSFSALVRECLIKELTDGR